LIGQRFNQEDAMTDYRDPTSRDPNRPGYRDLDAPMDQQAWSSATWGWIAGIAVVVLVLIFAFGGGRDQTATDTTSSPPATVGQRPTPTPPAAGPKSEAPTMMNRAAPAPTPTPPASGGDAR
jgi:hypothetical protein